MDRLERKTLLSKEFQISKRDSSPTTQKKIVENSIRMLKNKVFDSEYNSKHIEKQIQTKDIQITLKELHNIHENSQRIQKAKLQNKVRSISYQDHNDYNTVNSAYNIDQNKVQNDSSLQIADFYNIKQTNNSNYDKNNSRTECDYILNHKEFNFLFNHLNKEKNSVIRDKILDLEGKKPDFMICQNSTNQHITKILQIKESIPKYSSVEKNYKSSNYQHIPQIKEYSPFMNATRNIIMSNKQENILQRHIQNTNAHQYLRNSVKFSDSEANYSYDIKQGSQLKNNQSNISSSSNNGLQQNRDQNNKTPNSNQNNKEFNKYF